MQKGDFQELLFPMVRARFLILRKQLFSMILVFPFCESTISEYCKIVIFEKAVISLATIGELVHAHRVRYRSVSSHSSFLRLI